MKDSKEKDLFEGLQIPNEATRPIKSSVKKVVVKPHFTDEEMAKKEGTHCSEKDADTILPFVYSLLYSLCQNVKTNLPKQR